MKGMGLLVALMILFLVAFFGNSYLSPRNALNSVVNGEQSAPFSPDPRVFLFSLLWPVLIVQVLVPMLIVFWSGSDLFYPTSTHLGVRRLVCMILGIVASVVLGWITSLFL